MLLAKRAKMSAAYDSAKFYAQTGITLLSPIDWRKANDLVLNLYKELAINQFSTNEFSLAEENFQKRWDYAKDSLSKIEFNKLNCELLTATNKHEDAVKYGLVALKSVGISLPNKPNMLQVISAIIATKFFFWRYNPLRYPLKPIANPEYAVAIELMNEILPSAFMVNINLAILLILNSISLNLRYGYTESMPTRLVNYIGLIMHIFNRYEDAMSLVPLYQQLTNKFPDSSHLGMNYVLYGMYVAPWRSSVDETIEILLKGYQLALAAGDLNHCNYANFSLMSAALWTGKPFSEIKKYFDIYLSFNKKNNLKNLALALDTYCLFFNH